MIEDNLAAMVDLAHAHGIRVVLSSVLPASDFPWRPGHAAGAEDRGAERWMRDHAASTTRSTSTTTRPCATSARGMRGELAYDGVHPTEAGYRLMAPLAERAIAEALRRPAPVAAGRR
jgi:lysophospholipase L1-like esterase